MKSTGRWKPGESGNPRGRPVGVSDRRNALREKIEAAGDELVELAIAAARAGDTAALSLLLARAISPLRAASETVNFTIPEKASTADTGRAVMTAIADGHLSPDVGKQLLDGLAGLAKLIELDEIERRLAKLEQVQ